MNTSWQHVIEARQRAREELHRFREARRRLERAEERASRALQDAHIAFLEWEDEEERIKAPQLTVVETAGRRTIQ